MKILKLTGNGAARPSTPAARVCLALIGFVAIGPGVANAQICPSPFGTSTDGQLWPWAAWMEYYHVEFEDTLPDSFRASGETHLPFGQLDIQCRVTSAPGPPPQLLLLRLPPPVVALDVKSFSHGPAVYFLIVILCRKYAGWCM